MRQVLFYLALAVAATPGLAASLESTGNTDGVLTWRVANLPRGGMARHVLLFVWDASPDEAVRRLEDARQRYASSLASHTGAETAPAPELGRYWLRNEVTDFGVEGTGYFSWRLERQSFSCARGGQLSQYTWYVHYRDEQGEHHAGTPQVGDEKPENLRIIQPVRALSATEAAGVVETTDGKLRIATRVLLGPGSLAAQELTLTNQHTAPLRDVRVSAYANFEAAHDEANDLSYLDARTGGLLVFDPGTGITMILAGLGAPVSGHSGTWNSLPYAQRAEGVPFAQWKPFAPPPPEKLARLRVRALAPPGIYLPFLHDNPKTPETRTLTPAEAAAVLERDWLFQAEGKPLADRARQEIGWALAVAARLARHPNTPPLNRELAELHALSQRLRRPVDDAEARRLYLAVRRAKRRLFFRNPVLNFRQVLFIDQPTPAGPVNPEHEAIHRMGITAVPGGRLLVLDGLHPGGRVRKLAPNKPGSFWAPDLSFDAQRVLFCFKPHDEKSFHLYEIRLDGSGLRQLTNSPYDDIDPIYLPDGHILFTSTRGNSYVRCGPFIYSYTLARCDADGSNVYLISQNGEPDFVPSLLSDGRVIYSRWEYTDRPLWRIQSLWTTHPDGTNTMVFWGNKSVWPDHTAQPRQIPGSRRVMFVGVGHHDWFSGSIGIIDPTKGFDFPHGLTKVTADLRWPECSTPPVDPVESPDYHSSGHFTGYNTPYPLSEEDFLVSARREDGRFRLYLMDVHGNRELIYEGVHNIWHAIPIRPRPVPPRIPDRVAWPGTGNHRKPVQPGFFYSPDIYEGVPDLPRGSVRFLRVFQLDHKTYSTWAKTYRHSGPPVSVIQEEGVKRILSVVPVEADGSVYFEAPAGRSLYFQLLDEHGRCVQTMRSFTGLMPGERRGCVGCHESHSRAPVNRTGLALRRGPTPPSPPPWGTESISYERFAQPVLDRYCGSCHQGSGAGRRVLDLTLRPAYSVFKEPYVTLVGDAAWQSPPGNSGQAGYGIAGAIPVESIDPTMNDPKALATLRPGTMLSSSSRLIALAMSGKHHGVKVDGVDLQRLIAWVDACCPFMGEPELRALGDPDFPGIEELPIRPRVATAPVVQRP